MGDRRREVVWTQWADIAVPEQFIALNPATTPLESSDLSEITFYMSPYMGGRAALEVTRRMPKLSTFQVPNAGYDDALEFLRPGMLLCNARGIHDASTAELALALAIGVRRGFADFATAQAAGEWRHRRYQSFADSRIAIVGAGSIARTLARYLEPFDVDVVMFSRRGDNGSLSMADFDCRLPSFDIVFLMLPLNSDSRHLFDHRRFALLKPGATLVNVARGEIVDTDALLDALHAGRITAGLDVTSPEPLPADHPLWKAPNCVISPHVGGDSTAFESRGRRLAEEQLRRLAAGEPLLNIVAG